MSKLLISTEASTTVFPPMNSYYNSLRKVTVSSNQTSSKLLILIFILEVAILAMVHVSFESTNSLIILTSIEGLIILLSLIFCLVYRTKSRITQYLQKFNDAIISILVFALYLFKIEIFLEIHATRFVSLVGGMTLLPCILLADKCLVQLWHKLVLIGACFVYITARMAASEETDYVVSLQIALVFISSAYFLKRREETVQSLFSQVYCSYQKESSWHSIFRDFPEPIYLLNPDVKVAFTNVPCVENTKVAHEDTEKAMISNLESARNAGNSTDPFKYIQELELISDPELAFQFFKPLCFTGVNGIDDSAGDFLDDKDAQSARKSSRGIMSSPKGFRFSWKNDSGSLGHIQPIRTPTETMKAWLKGQNLVQLLEVLCKNTKRFYDFYRKSPIVLSGKVIEETTALLSPLRSTRDRAKDISGFKAVEVRLSVVNFQQEMNVLVMVTEKTIINPPSSLQSINEYKINLLASFSHELRNPLNGNLNFLETAIQRPDLPEDIKTDYLVPAWTSATLLLYIVNDILDYSQFSLNKIVLRIKSSKISCLLEDIVELFKIQFAKKNLKITLDYPANDEIATDHTRLSQILVNLVSNALKFTEEGGVHVTVVKTTEPPNCYKISVSDTGIGLAPKQRKKIERILKGEDSEKVDSKSVGSNLGLTTSGRLAVLLGPAKGNGITIEPVKKGTKLVFLIENKQQAQEKSLLDLSLSGLIGNSSPQMMDGSFRSDCPVEQPQQVTLQLKRDDLRKFTLRKSASSNDIQEAANEYKSKFSNDSQALMFTMPEEGKAAIVEKKSLTSGMVRVKGTHTGTTTTGIFSNSGKKMSMKMNSYKEPKCRCNFILIVDDDSFNVMAAEKMFSAVNLTPVSAFHGKQAIQVLESRQKCSETCQLFKFILMDCNMPVMDGYDATRYLKKKMKSGALPYIPIVGCTAFVTYFDAAKCFDSGMDDYVTKPLGKEKMTRILEKWVRNRPLVQGPAFNM